MSHIKGVTPDRAYACSKCPDCLCADMTRRLHAQQSVAVPVRGLNAAIYDAQAKMEAETSARYGIATGPMVGLDAFLSINRAFTRTEVLTILRTIKADTGVVAGKEALDRAIRVFEGME